MLSAYSIRQDITSTIRHTRKFLELCDQLITDADMAANDLSKCTATYTPTAEQSAEIVRLALETRSVHMPCDKCRRCVRVPYALGYFCQSCPCVRCASDRDNRVLADRTRRRRRHCHLLPAEDRRLQMPGYEPWEPPPPAELPHYCDPTTEVERRPTRTRRVKRIKERTGTQTILALSK